MRKLTTATLSVLLLFTGLLIAQGDPSKKKPNVIVFLTDDQGWGDLSINGNTNLSTPRIDSLATDGAQFDRFYVCPMCSPTRVTWKCSLHVSAQSSSATFVTRSSSERCSSSPPSSSLRESILPSMVSPSAGSQARNRTGASRGKATARYQRHH